MNEVDFRLMYEKDIPVFRGWGEYVNALITEKLMERIGDNEGLSAFLKIHPEPRVKDTKSILEKAFYRKKQYKDAYAEITDKVGVRYVVLLKSQIKFIEDVIRDNSSIWNYSKDRDFEADALENPESFSYQSVHYVVKNCHDVVYQNIKIPAGTPCEIQIRTLLQHAHSELTHDTVYKPKKLAAPDVKRIAAQSLALIEVSDDLFEKVNTTIGSDQMKAFMKQLKVLYQSFANPDYEERLSSFIMDSYEERLASINFSDLEKFVSEKIFIQDIIKTRANTSLLYRQPIVLLLYYMIYKQRNTTRSQWPLLDADLKPLYTDLGISFDSSL